MIRDLLTLRETVDAIWRESGEDYALVSAKLHALLAEEARFFAPRVAFTRLLRAEIRAVDEGAFAA